MVIFSKLLAYQRVTHGSGGLEPGFNQPVAPPDDVQLRIAKEELIWDAFAGQCLVFSARRCIGWKQKLQGTAKLDLSNL